MSMTINRSTLIIRFSVGSNRPALTIYRMVDSVLIAFFESFITHKHCHHPTPLLLLPFFSKHCHTHTPSTTLTSLRLYYPHTHTYTYTHTHTPLPHTHRRTQNSPAFKTPTRVSSSRRASHLWPPATRPSPESTGSTPKPSKPPRLLGCERTAARPRRSNR